MEDLALVYLIGGFVLLYVGGEFVVRGSVGLAKSMGVSPLLIGLVVVAFGTSSPELFIAIRAIAENADTIAVGNVVGSNIANILLVLGLGAFLYPIPARGAVVFRDGSVVLGATGLFIYLAYRGNIDQSAGIVLLGFLGAYLVFAYLQERIVFAPEQREETKRNRDVAGLMQRNGTLRSLIFTIIGIGLLILGAKYLVDGAIDIATRLNVSEGVIAVSIVALGTSVPELAMVVVASLRRHSQLVIGGILGSNIFNLLVVLGIPALFWNIEIAPEFLDRDIWVMAGAALILMPFMLTGGRIGRLAGLTLLALYAAYIYVLYAGLPPFVASLLG